MHEFMAIEESFSTTEHLKRIYKEERRAFLRLRETLNFDEKDAGKAVAFWMWLESQGFYNTVSWALALSHTDTYLYELADEAVWFFYFLESGERDDIERVNLTFYYHTSNGFSLQLLYAKRLEANNFFAWFFDKLYPRIFHS